MSLCPDHPPGEELTMKVVTLLALLCLSLTHICTSGQISFDLNQRNLAALAGGAGVLSFLGWTALRLRHRRLGGGGGALLAGLPSIRLKPGLFPDFKSQSKHQFPGRHHHPHVLHHKAPRTRHHPLITAKLEPSHEMIPKFLPSPPAEKLAVRARGKLVSGSSERQYL